MGRNRTLATTSTPAVPILGRNTPGWAVIAGSAAGVLFAGLAAGGSWERFGILLVGGWVLIGLCVTEPKLIVFLIVGTVVFVTMLGGPFAGPALDAGNSLGPKWVGAAVTEGQKQYNERVATPPTIPAIPTTAAPTAAAAP